MRGYRPARQGFGRIVGKFEFDPRTKCWNWKKSVNSAGYGTLGIRCRAEGTNESWLAHRYMWIVAYGRIPRGFNVLHKCDNPRCINPEHLFLGTSQDNVEDMMRKGRMVTLRGQQIGSSKLDEDKVREIKRLIASGIYSDSAIARRYGVCPSTINNIHAGLYWRHV